MQLTYGGETRWSLPGSGPRSTDVQWHIVFKQLSQTLRGLEGGGEAS